MHTAQACPEIDQYKKLATSQLSSADQEALLDHLQGSATCAQRLESLSEKDTLVDLIRQPRSADVAQAGETVARLVARLRELRPSSGSEPAAAEKAPAPILVACSGCGKELKVKAGLAGKKVKCPHCQAVIPVPLSEDLSRPSAAPIGDAVTMAPIGPHGGGSAVRTATDTAAGLSQPAGADQHLCDSWPPRSLRMNSAGWGLTGFSRCSARGAWA